MLLLGIDFETTGLDPEKDRIIEMGCVLWDVELRIPARMVNLLLRDEGDPPITSEVEKLTGITNAMLEAHGQPRRRLVQALSSMPEITAFVAHNGNRFDRAFLRAELERQGAPDLEHGLWIDTTVDVPYPEGITTRKLVHLAAEHGFLNPFAHRAIFDVLTMLVVLSNYDIEPVLESARQPTVVLIADVGFHNNQLAKDLGYRWKPELRQWRKDLKLHLVNDEIERARQAGFSVRQLNEEGTLDL